MNWPFDSWWKARKGQKQPEDRTALVVGDLVKMSVYMADWGKDKEVLGEIVEVNGGYVSVLFQFEASGVAGALRKA